MTPEDRLRDALHKEADMINPRDGWNAIQDRLGATPMGMPNRYRNRALAVGAAAALALVVGIAVITQPDDDAQPVVTEPAATIAPTLAPTIAPTVAPTVAPTTAAPRPTTTVAAAPRFVWPPSTSSFTTPRDAATSFARDFLTMPNPSIGAFQQGDLRSGEVVVRAKATSGPATNVLLREDAGKWYVVAANADNLELDTPSANALITSPVTLRGRSVAFEGTVQVAVLRYATTLQCTVPTDSCGSNPGVFANTFFTGNGTEKGPFEKSVTFSKPDAAHGYVVLWTNSAEDGTVSEATVRLVRFR